MKINLKRLISDKRTLPIIEKITESLGSPVSIVSAKGKVLLEFGKVKPNTTNKIPIKAFSETIGWVHGDEAATTVASILSLLVCKELEKRTLSTETLAVYKEIHFLYDFSQKLLSSLEIKEIADLIVVELKKLINSDYLSLMIYDKDRDVLKLLSTSQEGLKREIICSPGEGITGSVFRSGKGEIVNDVSKDQRFIKNDFRVSSMMCAPLKIKNKVIGVINVWSKEQKIFLARDLKLLENLSSQTARALDNALLFEKLERAFEEESELLKITNALSSELQLDRLLAKIINVTMNMLNSERGTLFLYDPKTHELWSSAAEGLTTKEIRFPASAGLAGTCFTTGETINIIDAYDDPRFNSEVDNKTGYRTRNILCMPILGKTGKKLGVLQILNKKEGSFSIKDEKRLEAFSAQAAIALENSQLFENLELAFREESELLKITTAISSELQLDRLLAKIVKVTTNMLNADRGTLFIFDPKTYELWSQVAEGLTTKEIRFPASAGLAGTCFTSGEVINIVDAYADKRFNPEIDTKTGYRTTNILCMSIIDKTGSKLGVLQVLNKKDGPFSIKDEQRLEAFSAQAAIALENSRLFEEACNAHNYNESILKSLSNGVITLDADRKISKINNAASRIFRLSEETVLERNISQIWGIDNLWIVESINKVAASGKIDLTLDADVKLNDGSVVSVNMASVPLIDINENYIGYMLIVEDISREKRVKSTMGRYMSKAVMEKLLTEDESILGGTAQDVTIFFSDIRSFTTISERLGARGTVSLLNDYFTNMVDIILSHHGILDKYIGDAIMALFGAPFSTGKDAENAITAANKIVVSLRELNRSRTKKGEDPILTGIGISTGEVIAGNVGSPKRMDYTVIGDSVNLASRLESATKFYGADILISKSTIDSIDSPGNLRELDRIRVKGKVKPVTILETLEHHTDETFPNLHDVIAAFEVGLDAYRQKNWKQAITYFKQAEKAHPNDKATQIYLQRCEYLRINPPEDDWDGVWTFKTK